jgi:hypothetical protein
MGSELAPSASAPRVRLFGGTRVDGLTAEAAGLADRARFEVAGAADYPGTGYGLVCVFDALHDMGDPVGAAGHILRSLDPEGTFMLVEPMAAGDEADSVDPVSRLFYPATLFICTANARAQGGPQELGNQVPDETWRRLLTDAGFSRFRRDTETPLNRSFEVRP